MMDNNHTEQETPAERSDKKAPGFWFYTADYERDVQILSLTAQGLWARMLCWMSDNEAHRGFLELPTGLPMSNADIAARVGKPQKEVDKAVIEMERVGIFSRDDRACIYSRRMARDTHISEVRRAAAKARLDSAKRAANGSFVGKVAPAKARLVPANHPVVPANTAVAPAKGSSKMEQNPTVTASVSDSVSTKRAAAAVDPPNIHAAAVPANEPPPPSVAEIRRQIGFVSTAKGWPSPPKAAAAVDEKFLETCESLREVLPDYPGADRLPGRPDDIVVRECVELAGGDPQRIGRALRTMIDHGKRPASSWKWFPTVMRQYLGGS
jgi:hypothetical protein